MHLYGTCHSSKAKSLIFPPRSYQRARRVNAASLYLHWWYISPASWRWYAFLIRILPTRMHQRVRAMDSNPQGFLLLTGKMLLERTVSRESPFSRPARGISSRRLWHGRSEQFFVQSLPTYFNAHILNRLASEFYTWKRSVTRRAAGKQRSQAICSMFGTISIVIS